MKMMMRLEDLANAIATFLVTVVWLVAILAMAGFLWWMLFGSGHA